LGSFRGAAVDPTGSNNINRLAEVNIISAEVNTEVKSDFATALYIYFNGLRYIYIW